MSWQRRLVEFLAAGGALSSAGCPGGGPPCGNANPDPCICGRMPDTAPQCVAEKSCRGDAGVWSVFQDAATDAQPDLRGVCYIPDAGVHD